MVSVLSCQAYMQKHLLATLFCCMHGDVYLRVLYQFSNEENEVALIVSTLACNFVFSPSIYM